MFPRLLLGSLLLIPLLLGFLVVATLLTYM
jgi:hypothetical protein